MMEVATVRLWWICMLLLACDEGIFAQEDGGTSTATTGESVKIVEVGLGESAILPCYQRATGSFLLEWKRRDLTESIFILLSPKTTEPHIDSRYTGRIDIVDDGVSLQMDDIRVEDAGSYQCTVNPLTNWDRSSNFTWINLVIKAPPVFLSTSPYRTVVGLGSIVNLFCITDSSSSTTITWLKDNKPLVLENRFEILSDSLTIYHLVMRDGGVYTCQAENALGTSEHNMLLIVEGAPYIVNPPQNVTVREGMSAMFLCGWDASPDNVTVYWFYDNEPVHSLAKFGLYADILPDGSLYIGDTDKAFSGWYTCNPSNGIGMPPSAKGFLSVQYPSTPQPMPSEIVGALGYSVTLNCHADSNPAISNTIWRKDSITLYPTADQRLSLGKSGSLTINEVKQSDEGFYSCQPYNSLGSAGESSSTYLLVRDAPIFTSRPKAYYQRMAGEEISIPCTASGSPPPTVTWRKVDGMLPMSRATTLEGTLRIVQLQKEDHGLYECLISNVVTTLVTSTQLIIEQTSPHAPYNVTVVTTSRSAVISWQPAYDGGLTQSYTVWFRSHNVDDSEWTTLSLLPEDVTSATLYNLRPNTQYEFSVIASNELGKSMFSEVVIASTKVLSPGPPVSVTVNSTSSALILKWETPREYPELVSLYTVEYRINGEIYWKVLIDDISSETREVKLTGLKAQTWYDFRMFAFTPGSFSIPSNIVTGFTGELSTYTVLGEDDNSGGIEGAVLAGIISGLVFLIIALILMITAVVIVRRRRQKKRELHEILGFPSYVQPGHSSAATSTPSFTLLRESYSSLKAKFSPVKVNPPKTRNRDDHGLKQRVVHKSRTKHIRKSPRSLHFDDITEPSIVDNSLPDRVLAVKFSGEDYEDGTSRHRLVLTPRPDEVLSTSEYALEVDINDEVFTPPRQFADDYRKTSRNTNNVQSHQLVRTASGAPNKPAGVFTTSSPLNDITQWSFASDNVSAVRRSSTSVKGYFESSTGQLKTDQNYYARRDENVNMHSHNCDKTMTMRELQNSQRTKHYSENVDFSHQRAYKNDQSNGMFVLRGDNSTNYIRRERIASPDSAEIYRREHKVFRPKNPRNLSLIQESSIDPPTTQKVSADVHNKVYTPIKPIMGHSKQMDTRYDEYKRTAPFLKRRRRTQEIDTSRLPQLQNSDYSLDRRKVRSVGDLRRGTRELNPGQLNCENYRPTINPRAYGPLNQRNYNTSVNQDFRIPLRYEFPHGERLPTINLPYIQPSPNEHDTLEVSPNYSGVSSSTSGVGSMVPSLNNVSPRTSTGPLSPQSQGSSGYGSRNTSQSVSVNGRNNSVVSNRPHVSNSSSLDSTFEEPLQVIDTYNPSGYPSTSGDPFDGVTDILQDRYHSFGSKSRKARVQDENMRVNDKPRVVHFDNNLIVESPTEEERWFARLKEEFNEYKRQQQVVHRRKLVSSV
ncbi:protein turtle homolog B-like isoform X2 [Antedon mediterranea]|uniref:protein turtle homolog B-like isoform X2 n=1 Tax=Antedon mediterranea TaxID=105859 RepID=UPI003AF5A384